MSEGLGLVQEQLSTDPAYLNSVKLLNVLLKRRKATAAANPTRWVPYFAALISTHGEDEVARVLDWYCQNPESFNVYSAKGFRDLYAKIRQRALASVDVELDEVSRTVLAQLRSSDWTKGVDALLPRAIKDSVANASKLSDKLANAELDVINMRLLLHLKRVGILNPKSMVLVWFNSCVKPLVRWSEFQAGPNSLVLDLNNPRFQTMMRRYTYAYCGDGTRWDRLLKGAGL